MKENCKSCVILDETDSSIKRRINLTMFGVGLLVLSWIYSFIFPDELEIAKAFAFMASVIVALPIFNTAIRGFFRNERLSLTEQLISLAILAAIGNGDFNTATLVPLFMIFGHLMEENSIQGVNEAISNLKKLTSPYATILRDGKESLIPTDELRKGDMIVVKPGESVPVDGKIIGGISAIDESPVTGESIPRDIGAGDEVFAGTMNMSGVIKIEVIKTGKETVMGVIENLIEKTRSSKTEITKIIDNYVDIYFPMIIFMAIATLIVTKDLNRAITILVVACPCAFVLAVPTAMIASIAMASRSGILIKNSAFLERISQVDTLVMDKTGTITYGNLSVEKILIEDLENEDEIKKIIYKMASISNHPVSLAIRKFGNIEKISDEGNIKEIAGSGIEFVNNGNTYRLGNKKWLKKNGVNFDIDNKFMGITVFFSKNSRLAGTIYLSDRIRNEVKETINNLKELGVKEILMLTGDRKEVAESIGKELGIDKVYSELMPDEKLGIVEQLKQEGKIVMVVGDGINDSLALTSGDVGVAMGETGCTIAIQSADIALINNNINSLVTSFKLSYETRKIIHINIIGGTGVSILMLVLAGFGIISPFSGAILHNIGALFVITNSARLLRFKG